MPEEVRFDLTLFTSDGDSPVWGSATGYVISEASFGTGGFSHPRPYLQVPENFLASKTDFLKGSSDIGGVSVRLLDVPTDPTDQTTGIVTSEITELGGAEAILRRWYDSLGVWRTIFRGRVKSVEVADTLVEYTLNLEDPRSFEERDLLFEINETFSLYPQPGPIENYGQFPSGEDYLLPAAAVAYTRFRRWNFGSSQFTTSPAAESTGGIYYGALDFDRDGDWNPNDFSVGDETLASPYEVFVERIDRLKKICDSDPTGVAIPESATTAAGLFGVTRLPVFRGYVVRWRLPGEGEGDWNYVRDHPAPPQFGLSNAVLDARREEAALYVASFDPADLPPYDTAIEVQVLARYTTSDTPYFYDGGTVGDILHSISQGELTRNVPRETYEASTLADFRTNTPRGRFIETSPQNRRRWVQKNVYQSVLYAPCLTQAYEIRPVPWPAPDDLADAPFLAKESIDPVGDWRQEFSVAYNTIEGTIIVENVRPQDFITRQRITWYKGIDESELNPNLSPWERYEATETQLLLRDEEAVAKVGPRPVEYSPNTLRTIGEVDGRTIGGDTEETSAGLVANRFLETAKTRWIPDGAPRFTGSCLMSDPVVRDAEVGDWQRVETPWLPDRTTKRRNAVRYMQILGITDESPERRLLHFEDGGIPGFDDENTDDPENPTSDCLDNATTENTSTSISSIDGRKMLVFSGDGTYDLHNDCGVDIEFEVLLIGGGGGGGGADSGNAVGQTPSAGGGGAAGGVFGAYGADDVQDATATPQTLTIKAGATVTVTVGAGGAAGASAGPTQGVDGGDTIIWVDANGDALDPMTDTPIYFACGGGRGGAGVSGAGAGSAGGVGGSAGGAGARGHVGSAGRGASTESCSQGASPGAQGSRGGNSESTTGVTNCATARSGGGGAFGGAGVDGTAVTGAPSGGPGVTLTNWNGLMTGGGGAGAFARIAVAEGGCASGTVPDVTLLPGTAGTGGNFGRGGNGGLSAALPASAGTDGLAVLRYVGAAPSLTAPDSTVATPSEDPSRRCVTVAEADWPAVPPAGYRVRVEYAVSETEPPTNSGLWLTAGYLDAPGTVCTPPLASGATVWTRVIAEADGAPPSTPSTPTSGATGQVPDLLTFTLSRSGNTVSGAFNPNAACGGIRMYGYVAPEGTPYDSADQAELDEIDAAAGAYTPPLTITQGEVMHIAAECWPAYGAADPDEGLLASDDFDRADSATVGTGWSEFEGTGAAAIASNRLELTAPSGAVEAYRDDVDAGEQFVQGILNLTGDAQAHLYARLDDPEGGATRTGYVLSMRQSVNLSGLYRDDGGALTALDTNAVQIGTTTDWYGQLYVADGVQEATYGPTGDPDQESASATDTDHDATTGTASVRMVRNAGSPTLLADDHMVFASKNILVHNLPAGYKAKVRNSGAGVVAEGTESSGTATADCSLFGGCTEVVPFAGWEDLVITDGADVIQHTEAGPVYPGGVFFWSDDGTLTGVSGTQGNTKVRSLTYATPGAASPGDILTTLDRLMFDDNFNIMLDDEYNPLLADE